MNNHHQQNTTENKENGNENSPPLSPHFSPVLFVISLILFGYASYLLMTNSKLFCIYGVIHSSLELQNVVTHSNELPIMSKTIGKFMFYKI